MDYSLSEKLNFVGLLSRFGLLCLHVLIDLDALEGSDLSDVLLECRVAATNSHHDSFIEVCMNDFRTH